MSAPPNDRWSDVPREFRDAAQRVRPDARPAAWLLTDLDEQLRYRPGLIAIHGSDLFAFSANEAPRSWPLHTISDIRVLDQGSTGTLELLGPAGVLDRWRFSAACSRAADRLAEQFRQLRSGLDFVRAGEAEESGRVCPSCGGPLLVQGGACPACDEDAEQPEGPRAQSMLRLARFARPWLGTIIFGFLLTVAGTAVGLIPPYLTIPLVDRVLIPYQNGEPVERSLAVWYLAGLAGASILAWLLSWGRTYVLAWVSERISAELRNRTYEHLQRLSLRFFGGRRTGDLIARVSSDTDRICYFLSVYVIDFASDVLLIVMTAAVLFWLDPLLAALTLAPLPLVAWMVQRAREGLRGGFAAGGRAWGHMTSVLADTIPGIRVVKAFAQERREVERFREANQRVLHANDRVNRTWSFFSPMVVLMTDLGLVAVWAFGTWAVFSQGLKVGVLTGFVLYIGRFYSRLDSMSRMLAAVQRAAASAHRIFEIMDVVPDVPEPARPVRLERVEGEIEFRNVSFRYGNREVIRSVDLTIRPGELVGLVGPSGAGKTTLVNLACRFYDVTDGAILVDGIDIRDLSVAEFRRNIGLVLQEPFLFYGTIAENIAYGRPDAGRPEIIAAARAARAHDFVMRLPDGYDSMVGERGQMLSGGERQRISIARALLIDPAILILDEATSSVDTETEREIQLALENLIQGRTTIAIAHRLSTLHRADRLVVLEDGRITEIGPHQELIKHPGTYQRLHQAQLELAQGQAV
jgi:ATP-binding cassette subfamily B protein